MVRKQTDRNGFMTLKITLSQSTIMRTIVVPETVTLEDLHRAIQSVMGWNDSHLWKFTTTQNGRDGITYELPYEDDWEPSLDTQKKVDPSKVALESVFTSRGAKLYYEYDFGDSWDHVITRMADSKEASIACVKSSGPDGIDDIGGVWGLMDYIDQLKTDPNSDDCAETREWSGLDDDDKVCRYLAGRSLAAMTKDLRSALSHVKLPVVGRKSPRKSAGDEEQARLMGAVFACTLDENTWGLVEDALQNGGTCTFDDPKMEIVPYLKTHFDGIEIKKVSGGDSVDKRLMMTVPQSWVRLYAAHAAEWNDQRGWLDVLESYACAAVHLYGVVTLEELAEIIEHYDPGVSDGGDFLDRFFEVRACCPEITFRKDGDLLISDWAFSTEIEDVELNISEMREIQRKYPRWYPATREDFFKWEYDDYFERSAETGALASAVKAVCKINDRDKLEEIVSASYAFLQIDLPADLVVKSLVMMDYLPKVSSKPRQRIIDAVEQLSKVVRSIFLNGNRIRDVMENIPPLESEKPKISRNAPCPCGSGKKYKMCCGRAEK